MGLDGPAAHAAKLIVTGRNKGSTPCVTLARRSPSST